MLLDTDLNVRSRQQRNRLPWRGQFTPNLVDNLINDLTDARHVILDPFCGSGTVLQRGAKAGFQTVIGYDINPAAVILSRTNEFINMDVYERLRLVSMATDIIGDNYLLSVDDILSQLLAVNELKSVSQLLICLSANSDSEEISLSQLKKSLNKATKVLSELPYNKLVKVIVEQRDCRFTSLPESHCDIVITSPPYINVFNYHQNHRKKIERYLGEKPLSIAPSEIGSNRKFRQNRFKTAIQYIKDMYLFTSEMHRVVKDDGIITAVVGKESRIMGVPFYNGLILHDLLTSSGAFKEIASKSRSFTNMYGEDIEEQVLVFRIDKNNLHYDFSKEIIEKHFMLALTNCKESEKPMIEEALEQLSNIPTSQNYVA